MARTLVNARVTFRSSPIHVMEGFAFRDVGSALEGFRAHAGLDECAIVQTCNRVEVYGSAESYSAERIKRTWASLAGLDEGSFRGNLTVCDSSEAVEHLLRVASGLDSMVLGEEQVLSQVRRSIEYAREAGAAGSTLDAVFDRAVKVGARARSATGISRGGVSVGSMAVRLAEDALGGLREKRVLLIGTGETSSLVAKSLVQRECAFDVSSRTPERAHSFCAAVGGTPARFEDAVAAFGSYDAIFVATTAPYHLVTAERIAPRGRAMMIVDLSNPRTVDERVGRIAGVTLANLDQISEVVERNAAGRRAEARRVEEMIGAEVPLVEATMRRTRVEPLVSDVFRRADSVRERELAKALAMLRGADERTIKVMTDMTHSIMEGIVSPHIEQIKRASEQDLADVVSAARMLWGQQDARGARA